MSQFSLNCVIEALQEEDKAVRYEADFCFSVLEKVCKRALGSKTKLKKDYFPSISKSVYEFADKNTRLKALWRGLFALYEFHAEINPQLLPPVERRVLGEWGTVISERMPPLALQEFLYSKVLTSLESRKTPESEKWLMLALRLSTAAGIYDQEDLISLIGQPEDRFVILGVAQRAFVYLPDSKSGTRQIKVIWLDAVALLYLRRLRSLTCHKVSVKEISELFKMWWLSVREQNDLLYKESLSLKEALKALNFKCVPFAQADYSSLFTPLEINSLARALTGNRAPEDLIEEEKKSRRQRRIHRKEFTELIKKQSEHSGALSLFSDHIRIGVDNKPGSADQRLIASMRHSLKKYQVSEPKERRNSNHYKVLKYELLELVKGALSDNQKVSATTGLITLYCVDLCLHGSRWKDKLAINTILTYLSTLTRFAAIAWCNDELLVAAQSSDDALAQQSLIVSETLSDVKANDKQGTAIYFLDYLCGVPCVRLFDEGELEYEGAITANTRAHYVNQHHFECACSEFLSEIDTPERQQTALRMRLCFYLGLRSNESLHLKVDDICFEADVLYVSRERKRKSGHAIRRIPLCFLPASTANELLDYQQLRKLGGWSTLFDEATLQAMEDVFISTLRGVCENEELVLHSLRHCAANNIMLLLAKCCFREEILLQGRNNLLSQEVLGEEQMQRAIKAFEAQGRDLNIYFPILDFLSQTLGHVSPAVTVVSYLHLLDYLFFELNSDRGRQLAVEELRFLLPDNTYRYTVLKEYQNIGSEEQAAFLFKVATHGFSCPANKLKANSLKHPELKSRPLSLSAFISELVNFKSIQRKQSDPTEVSSLLNQYFIKHSHKLSVQFLSDMTARSYPSYVRLLERLSASNTSWGDENIAAIESMKTMLTQGFVTDIRSVNRLLKVMQMMGHQGLIFKLQVPVNEPSALMRSVKWKDLLSSKGHSTKIQKCEFIQKLTLEVKPIRLSWPMWRYLADFLPVVTSYANYITTTVKEAEKV